MRARRVYLRLTAAEHRLMLCGLLHFRNKLIAQGRYTDAVDELLARMM